MSDPEGTVTVPLVSNHRIHSPLRYPGGKSVLSAFIAELITRSRLEEGIYVEPYAGGAGVALRLLAGNVVSSIVINDLDPCVFAFWDSIVNRSDGFLKIFDSVEPTMEEWHRQKDIIRAPASGTELGFAFFFLNRTNRSGVINGGVIGGLSQTGTYKIDARYNKRSLREKLDFIKSHSSKITVTNKDGNDIVNEYATLNNSFIYADPPYVKKGGSLYMNAFGDEDHIRLSNTLNQLADKKWVLTYDDTPFIRQLYQDRFGGRFPLSYSASSRRVANELVIFSDSLRAIIDASSIREARND